MMNQPLRILFVNRMAGMVRGGGETFDLEMSNELSREGCDVTLLTGKPLFSNPKPSPTDTSILSADRIKVIRTPYLPWFPWDKVRAGWRVRVWEFQQFERKAARWIQQHADEFDIIQICELPYLVNRLKVQGSRLKGGEKAVEGLRLKVKGEERRTVTGSRLKVEGQERRIIEAGDKRADAQSSTLNLEPSTFNHETSTLNLEPLTAILNPKIVLRLTAPNAHDPWGGIQAADAVIASGTSIAKVRQSLRPDVHDVPNGVNLVVFSQSESLRGKASRFRELHKIPAHAPVLLYVARYQDFKKHDLLIRSFSTVLKEEPEVRLVLAGSGPLRSELVKQIKSAGISDRVILLGEVGFEQLPAVYAAADIKVISSEYESFCFAAIEAMAAGLPVVTTDCGWVPKLIGDALPPIEKQWSHGGDAPGRFEVEEDGMRIREAPGGLVVGRTDPGSLANAVLQMIRAPGLRESCGRWNRARAVREHGWESSAKKLLAVYEDLLH